MNDPTAFLSDGFTSLASISIIGASVSGLLAGIEAAKEGINVQIYEEHREIGVPEKCDGLVSARGIAELGLVPPSNTIQNRIKRALFFSPSKKTQIEINAERQNVLVLDRARFDKFLAEKAASTGVNINVGRRINEISQGPDSVGVLLADGGTFQNDIVLDCSGYESYIRSGESATLQGGQYLVYGRWFESATVEVYIDPEKAPGFFFWVIPISNDMAKIGVAGSAVNTFKQLDRFCLEHAAIPIRKIAAPVVCLGALKQFVDRRVARAGDAAGQAKPTTGGGIYTCGYGGMLAGRAAALAIKNSNPLELENYEKQWRAKFGREFRLQLYARNAFAKMNSAQIEDLFQMIKSSDVPQRISEESDFDMHSTSIIRALGLSRVVRTFGMLFSNELKSLQFS